RAMDGARLTMLTNDDAHVAAVVGALPAQVVAIPWPADPSRALEAVRALRPDVVVVDSYAASSDVLGSLRSVAFVVVVDDLADRRLSVDVVVNGGAGAQPPPGRRAARPVVPLRPC